MRIILLCLGLTRVAALLLLAAAAGVAALTAVHFAVVRLRQG